MADQTPQIRRYNANTETWENINPKTLASLVKYDNTNNSVKDVLDSKVSKVTSTDNAIVRFNGTDGTVQNSSAKVDDNGQIIATGFKGEALHLIDEAGSGSHQLDLLVDDALSKDVMVLFQAKSGTIALKEDISNNTITIKKNGTEVGTFNLNGDESTIDITDVASAAALSTVSGNVTTVSNDLATHKSASNPHNITPAKIGAVATTAAGAANGVASLDANKKIPLSQLPDVILGQLMYGGTVDASSVATTSTNLKTKLGITDSTIKLVNSATDTTSKSPKEYGYKTLEGAYFIASATGTIAGQAVVVGDWVLSTGGAWKIIDNTDAVTSVNGQTGAVNLTAEDIMFDNSQNVYAAIEAIQDSLITAENDIAALESNKQNKVSTLGSSTEPVYVSANGVFSKGSKYAGGTKVTLNGSDKGAGTASFFAPTSIGTAGQSIRVNAAGTGFEYYNPVDTDTNTWRAIKVNGTQQKGTGINTGAIDFYAGNNVSLSYAQDRITISAVNTTYTAGAGLTLDSNTFKLAIAMGDTAPSNPANGCIWFDTSN